MRAFQPEDMAEVVAWHQARGLLVPPASTYPPTGVIVPGVAAGFLVKTDTSMAQIDGLISNPLATGRQIAISQIIDRLVELAKEAGFRHVMGVTMVPSVVTAGHGARFSSIVEPYTLLFKELT